MMDHEINQPFDPNHPNADSQPTPALDYSACRTVDDIERVLRRNPKPRVLGWLDGIATGKVPASFYSEQPGLYVRAEAVNRLAEVYDAYTRITK